MRKRRRKRRDAICWNPPSLPPTILFYQCRLLGPSSLLLGYLGLYSGTTRTDHPCWPISSQDLNYLKFCNGTNFRMSVLGVSVIKFYYYFRGHFLNCVFLREINSWVFHNLCKTAFAVSSIQLRRRLLRSTIFLLSISFSFFVLSIKSILFSF